MCNNSTVIFEKISVRISSLRGNQKCAPEHYPHFNYSPSWIAYDIALPAGVLPHIQRVCSSED